jgi:hypothetical protein
MTEQRARRDHVPNANNPRLLLRLIGLVASGIRRPRALAEVLGVEVRTIHYYSQAGEWLGLMTGEKDLLLTHEGMALAFAEPRDRKRLYAAAVWRNPFAAALLEGRGMMPETDVVAAAIRSVEPDLAEATALRRASAVRGMIRPALGYRPSNRKGSTQQLMLPLSPPRPGQRAAAAVDLRAGPEESPDVYARILGALLDHGELSTTQLRNLLDGMGARDAAIGSYVEMALRRCDAQRIDDRLVATAGAAFRRHLADDPVLLAVSDPLYRQWLEEVSGMSDKRQSSLGSRFAHWDTRIFGERLKPATAAAAIDMVLMGRRLATLTRAGDPMHVAAQTEGAFIDLLGVEGLAIAFPTTLADLKGGVAPINDGLRILRESPARVRAPTLLDARARIHGGLLSPGETPPRAIPDTHSLRLRCLSRTPAFALLGATLLLGRSSDTRLTVTLGGNGPRMRVRRRDLGALTDGWAEFAAEQGWICLQPPYAEGSGVALVDAAVALGIAHDIGGTLLLDEALFAGMQEDAELIMVREAIDGLADRLASWLDGLDSGR